VRGATPAGLHDERAVLDALRSLRRIPDATPAEVLHRILDAAALAKLVRREPPRVRALVGALLEEAGAAAVPPSLPMNSVARSTRLTRYRMPEAAAWLKSAADWGICWPRHPLGPRDWLSDAISASGERKRALETRTRLLALWRRADAELQPVLADVWSRVTVPER
jgi:hypothetical protein